MHQTTLEYQKGIFFQKHDLMKHVSHQCIVMQFILELAKSLKTDPRSCVGAFFSRFVPLWTRYWLFMFYRKQWNMMWRSMVILFKSDCFDFFCCCFLHSPLLISKLESHNICMLLKPKDVLPWVSLKWCKICLSVFFISKLFWVDNFMEEKNTKF